MTEELHYRRAADQHGPSWNEQVIDQQLDALFQDLELKLNQAVDGSAQPGGSALQPQAAAPLAHSVEYLNPIPAAVGEIEEALQELYGPMEVQLDLVSVEARPIERFSPLLPANNPPLVNDRLLFGMASASWVITLLLWLGSQFQGAPTSRVAVVPEQPPVPAQSPSPSPSIPLPPAPPQRPSPPVSPPVVRVPPPPAVQSPPIPRPQPAPQQAPAPIQAAQPAPAATAPPAAMVKDRPAASATPSAPPAPPVVDRTLQGLLALGDRSVALLEIDGVPRQVRIGETIDASGWQLLEVAEDHAVLQRQGEQRSIYVGQSF